ncbi:MAG: S9 family peptidase [Polyangiaceae bacterium]|nr:S9 family peptidase [Polyangiaceae bacterium]
MTPPPRAPEPAAPVAAEPAPPVAKKVPSSTLLHGAERADDYAWLKRKGEADVEDYLRAENVYAEAALRPTEGLQKRLYEEMLGRVQQADVSAPYPRGGWLYYRRTDEGKQYPVYCRKRPGEGAAEEVLLDLNEMAKGEKFLSLGPAEPSDDGNLLAYAVDTQGFRVYDLHVKDLRSGRLLDDQAHDVGSLAWAADNKTLFYSVKDKAKRPYRLYRHALGAAAAADAVVYEEKDERFLVGASRTRSGKYIVMSVGSHTTSEAHVLEAAHPTGAFRVVAPRRQDHEYEVDHRGDLFYIRTNDKGRNFRLVTAPTADPSPAKWKELVPHRDDVMLENVDAFQDFVALLERKDALPSLRLLDPAGGRPTAIAMPEPIYSVWPAENYEFKAKTYRYSYTSFVTPESVYEANAKTGASTLLKRTPVPNYDPSLYAQERVYATAPDGAKVPVSVVYKKGAQKRDGSAPVFLYGYGSYGVTIPVSFRLSPVSMLDRGVTFALAHIRGGGDLGKPWHDAGRMMQKRNTFTDFIAAAERLVAERYAAPGRVAIAGGSAGGLLMGAVVNQRPELFRAVLAQVPFVDVVNTMLDETLPLTVGEFEEWGNPKEKPAYDYMMSYSPYDNVKAQNYPAMLVVSAYHDSQVFYHEPAKWVAKLRATKTDKNLLALRMNMEGAGHGGKSGRFDALRDRAIEHAFLLWQLGLGQ